MLDTEKPDVAVVDNFYASHAEASMAVLERGIHLFAEKPLATQLSQLEQLEEAHQKAGVVMLPMFNYHYYGTFQKAHALIREGAIGAVRLLNAQKSYRLGTRPDFMKVRSSYGGTIPWVGIHGIDWINWLSGKKFVSASALQSTLYNRGNGDLEVSGLVQFAMEDEIAASLTFDYLNPATAPRHGDDRIRVVGSEGVLEIRDQELTLINADAPGIQKPECPPDVDIFADFLNVIEGCGSGLLTAQDGFRATEAALRAQMAADCGKTILF